MEYSKKQPIDSQLQEDLREAESTFDLIGIIRDIDYEVSSTLQKWRTKFGNYFWKFWTQAGYPYPWIAVALFFGLIFDLYHVAYVIMFAGLSSLAVVYPIKLHYKRTRPYNKHADLEPLKRERAKDYSFPSGHAYNATVNALALAFCYGGLYSFLLMFGLSILVAVSRLYLGVHFLSDVAVAFILGMLVAYIIYLCFPYIMMLHYLTMEL